MSDPDLARDSVALLAKETTFERRRRAIMAASGVVLDRLAEGIGLERRSPAESDVRVRVRCLQFWMMVA